MKKIIIPILLLTIIIASCTKIRLNKLEGKWKATSLKASTFGFSIDVQQYVDSIILYFNEDKTVDVTYGVAGQTYTATSSWADQDKVKELVFTNAFPIFMDGQIYDVEELEKDELILTGTIVPDTSWGVDLQGLEGISVNVEYTFAKMD